MFASIVKKAKEKYPNYSSQIDTVVSTINLQSLWKNGHQWMQNPVKDFSVGQNIFMKILAVSPQDYFATLVVGGCYIWSQPPLKNLVLGETYIQKAITINPSRTNAYGLLAQCNLLKGDKKGVLQIVNEMLSKNFPGIESDKDQLEKIVEAVDCARQVTNLQDPEYKAILATAKSKYPQLAQHLSNLSNNNNCVTM